MKYKEKEFTSDLKEKIKNTEAALKSLIEKLVNENKPVFKKKGLDLDAEFERLGNDPFHPGYSSSISIGIYDENCELTDLQIIKIWECERHFLGVPVSKKIPGNKIAGDLLDESSEEIKQELKDFIGEQLTITND
ncbi:hypothetical protein GKZ89_18280 [Bacillus mangrovi]|uniref:Uncharacterized protein n=1 Tax=Metabacillus mangrovi TaxID=1491830 RepID=A0A7X2S8R0_9BACI|nr:hypothetical protein [Metabacillus mangrovi]MTH55345.1 hypothetical protein [Metabacillus mangrovi]